ncbi:MAG: Ig-like domain-containing protein [Candidatus Krumholzibacteriia bacterium]
MRRLPLFLIGLLLAAALGCNIEDTTEPQGDPVPEVIETPLSGSVEQGIPLDLSWLLDDRFAWRDSFVVRCDTMRPPLVEVYAGAEAACTVGDLLENRTYYWTVSATDTSGRAYTFGPWSFAVRPFRCRLSPLPEHLTLNLEPDPLLSWNIASATDSVSYYLAYCDSVNPPQRLVYAGAEPSFRMTGLAFETTYYWRVTAVDAADNTDTSGPWRFDTGPPLFMVDLVPTPGDSAAGLDRVVGLSWAVQWSTAPVENYVVFLDDHPQPTSLVYAGTGTGVTLNDLRYGRTYWWSVTAFDDDGHTFTNGPWLLTIRDFDVEADPSPADGSTQVSPTGSLNWNVTRGQEMVVNWLVLLDSSPQPTTPVYTGPATSLDLAGLSLAPNTTYYWRVTALDIDGFTCPLGPWSFTTAP